MKIANDINSFSSVLDKEQMDAAAFVIKAVVDGTYDFQYGTKKELTAGLSVVFIQAEKSFAYAGVLEAHRKYHDLHCTIQGTDIIVSKPVAECTNIKKEYDAEADYILYNEQVEDEHFLEAGWMCLLPPADAHMALLGDGGMVKKLVFKIAVK